MTKKSTNKFVQKKFKKRKFPKRALAASSKGDKAQQVPLTPKDNKEQTTPNCPPSANSCLLTSIYYLSGNATPTMGSACMGGHMQINPMVHEVDVVGGKEATESEQIPQVELGCGLHNPLVQ